MYQTMKATATRPSDLLAIDDRWTALQFDNAVTLVGNVIENAAQEQIKTGSDDKPKWKNKYEMADLLREDFRLPNPNAEEPLAEYEAKLKGLGIQL